MHGTMKPADCWDKLKAFYDLTKETVIKVLEDDPSILEEVFTENPGLIPVPPAVIDGTPAAPGEVGELIHAQFLGIFNDVPSGGLAVGNLFVTPLPAGDWEISYRFSVSGGQVLAAACSLDPTAVPALPIPGNLLASAIASASMFPALPNLPVLCPPTPLNTATAVALVFQCITYSGVGLPVPSVPYQFDLWCRRMR